MNSAMKGLVLLFSLFLMACGGSNFRGGEENEAGQAINTQFYLEDNLAQETSRFVQDESVTFFLSLTNNSSREITFEFSSSQQYDFYVVNAVNTEVWRWSGFQSFTQGLSSIIIPAGDTVVFREPWNQRAFNGTLLPVGNYTAYGTILGQDEQEYDLEIQ